jgi:hypothetical protein
MTVTYEGYQKLYIVHYYVSIFSLYFSEKSLLTLTVEVETYI